MNKKITKLAAVAFLLFSTFANAQWTDLNIPSQFQMAHAIHFTSPTTGFLCGVGANANGLYDGLIYKTTDGGNTWAPSLIVAADNTGPVPRTFTLGELFFVDANTGFAVGSNWVYGFVCKTTNGGTTWDTLTTYNITNGFNAAWFLDANTGFCAGDDNTIAKTTDGGNSWSLVYGPGGASPMMDVQFVNSSVGYACAYATANLGIVYKTTNGGSSWTNIYSVSNENLSALHFLDANTGYVLGAGTTGEVYKTTNGGTTWTTSTTGLNGPHALHFVTPQIGYVSGINGFSASIYKTTNGGTSWTQDHSLMGLYSSYDFSFSGSTAYCVRINGISKTTNAPIGITEQDVASLQINLYPVPVSDFITIENSSNSKITGVGIYDCSGRLILNHPGDSAIDVSSLSPGIYSLTISTENFSAVKKIIKE